MLATSTFSIPTLLFSVTQELLVCNYPLASRSPLFPPLVLPGSTKNSSIPNLFRIQAWMSPLGTSFCTYSTFWLTLLNMTSTSIHQSYDKWQNFLCLIPISVCMCLYFIYHFTSDGETFSISWLLWIVDPSGLYGGSVIFHTNFILSTVCNGSLFFSISSPTLKSLLTVTLGMKWYLPVVLTQFCVMLKTYSYSFGKYLFNSALHL